MSIAKNVSSRVAAPFCEMICERGLDRIPRRDAHEQEDEREEDEDHRHDEREARDEVRPERGAGHGVLRIEEGEAPRSERPSRSLGSVTSR
jgi:hypothetical protein